jgi:hypothetical protein
MERSLAQSAMAAASHENSDSSSEAFESICHAARSIIEESWLGTDSRFVGYPEVTDVSGREVANSW